MMTADGRPDPDQLLEAVQAEEERAQRGHLRIFFGAAAGVGKTYAMLQAAHAMKASGVDVVVGYVEPHGRTETERLLEGLERLPTLPVRYRGIVRQEFDLDAAQARHPAILLVDELAHTNLVGGEPPPRHAKRWQDVEELLRRGITVWTTVNVQHLESLNDLIAQTSGIRQRETIPDRIFDEADQVELIDLPPEDLLARLKAGKIYIADEAATAIERFFRTSNLLALRELALRRVADRVEATARASLAGGRNGGTRLAGDRILVAVGPDDQAEQLIRAGKRMADALDARWTAVYVETPALLRLSEAGRNRRVDLMRLAESLGAETVTLDGPSAARTLIEYARTRHVTRLVVGSPKRRGWRALLRPSTTTGLVHEARGIDVITIAPLASPFVTRRERVSRPVGDEAPRIKWRHYAWALLITAACTAIAWPMFPQFDAVNLAMIYLLGVVIAGLRLGRGPSVLTSIANVAAFDFFFIQPRVSLAITNAQYLVTFGVMLTVALVTATLMASVRQQTRVAGARERRTALLYAMSRELAATRGLTSIARAAVHHVAEVFQCRAVVLLPDAAGKLRHPEGPPAGQSFRGADLAVAQWVADHGQRAGLGSDTLAASKGLYLPLGDERRPQGVLAVLPSNPRRVLLPEQRHLLETFAGQIGLALERARLAEDAESARVTAESESVRNTLLASISHDLRTPLSVIAGAASALAERGPALGEESRAQLARSIEDKAREMATLVSNVLDLTRLEAGRLDLRRDWQTVDDLVGAALNSVGKRLANHPVDVQLPDHLPAVHVDATLGIQVLTNLLDNVAKYTPAGTPVHIGATVEGDFVRITVDDQGQGLPEADPAQLFDKFTRGQDEGTTVGAGLGLAICRAIVRAHGGEIEAGTRPGGGARFEFTLPTGRATPAEPAR